MSKFTKKDLKKILKECLLEILREEPAIFQQQTKRNNIASNNNNEEEIEERDYSSYTKRDAKSVAQDMVDRVMPEGGGMLPSIPPDKNVENPVLLEKVTRLANSFGDNKEKQTYADIFADTAATTLQAQGRGVTTEQLQTLGEDAQIEKLTGPSGDITRWAQVAFAGNNKKEVSTSSSPKK